LDEISTRIDDIIKRAIKEYDGNLSWPDDSFEKLLSFGELVDRLSIVNFKLYDLKDEVINKGDDDFRAWASVEDVRLVEERARLKKCIDEKLIKVIIRIGDGDFSGGFNPEVKKYGG